MKPPEQASGARSRPLTDRTAFAVLAAATALLFWKIVFLGRVLYWGDQMLQFVPWREFANRSLRAGELPLWNPYSFCGEPFLANPQVALFYPWNVLGVLLPPERCLAFGAVAHTLLVAWGMYLFLRELRLDRAPALLGALAFGLSGCLVSRHQFPSLIDAVVWLPLALLWTHRTLERPTPGRAACLAAVTAAHLLAGHTQMSLFIFVLQLVCLAMQVSARPGNGIALVRRGDWVVLAVIVGCLAAAIQLLPTAELVRHSTRASLTMEQVTRFSLPWWQAPALLLPALFGSPALGNYWGAGNFWEVCGYVGTVPLLLALCGLFASRRRERWVLGGLFAVALLLAFGRYAPFFGWLANALPVVKLFRDPARFLLLCTFALSVLSAFGLEALLRAGAHVSAGRLFRRLTYGLAAVCFLAAAAAMLGGSMLQRLFQPFFVFCLEQGGKSAPPEAMADLTTAALLGGQLALVIGVVWLGSISLLVRRTAQRQAPWATAVAPLLCLTAIELCLHGMSLNPTTRASSLNQRPEIASTLHSGGGMYRVYTPLDSVDAWWGRYANYARFGKSDSETLHNAIQGFAPNLHMREGALNASGYNPLRVRWLWEELERVEKAPTSERSQQFLGAASVAEVVRYDPEALLPAVTPQLPVYPRAALWPARAVDPDQPPAGRSRLDPLDAVSFRSNTVTASCQAPGPRAFVVSDTFYPGWRATVDGKPWAIDRVFLAFRGVRLPAGPHEVKLAYYPQSLRFGAFLTLIGVLLLAAAGARQAIVVLWCLRKFTRREPLR